jgi:Arc/MetJ-type ribon-helix-helix transcriptional regulator
MADASTRSCANFVGVGENVKRVNVTLPVEQVEGIRRLMAEQPSAYPSVSAFVAEAIAERLADAEAHHMLVGVLRELGGEPTAEDVAWAEQALRLADEAAQVHGHGTGKGAA